MKIKSLVKYPKTSGGASTVRGKVYEVLTKEQMKEKGFSNDFFEDHTTYEIVFFIDEDGDVAELYPEEYEIVEGE